MKYKVLSLSQPWASLLAAGLKTIETRSWGTKYRGRILVHASAGWTEAQRMAAASFQMNGLLPLDSCNRRRRGEPHVLPFGAIIGEVNVVGTLPTDWIKRALELAEGHPVTPAIETVQMTLDKLRHRIAFPSREILLGDYALGRSGWICQDAALFPEPIPAKGQLGIWNWEGELPPSSTWIFDSLNVAPYA